MADKIRENYRNEGYSSNNRERNRSRGQGKELLQGIIVMAEIEALAMIDLDWGPELVQIGIE